MILFTNVVKFTFLVCQVSLLLMYWRRYLVREGGFRQGLLCQLYVCTMYLSRLQRKKTERGREFMLLTLLFSFTACHKIILSGEKSKTVGTALIFMWQVLPLQTYGRSFISKSGFYHRVRCTLTYEWIESFLLSVSVNVKRWTAIHFSALPCCHCPDISECTTSFTWGVFKIYGPWI